MSVMKEIPSPRTEEKVLVDPHTIVASPHTDRVTKGGTPLVLERS